MRAGILVSGRGSNLLALLAAFPPLHPAVTIVCVVSNRPDCTALAHAVAAGVSAHAVPRSAYPSRQAQQAEIARLLAEAGVELVVLAGYDQVLGPPLLDAFPLRIINIHPSLLPSFAGSLHAQADALRHGVKLTGCTVHYVTAEVDGGPIIAQAAVPVLDDDDETALSRRILEQEHRLLPLAVAWIAEGRVRIEGRRVRVVGTTEHPDA